ncbi:MAG: hypothetical protein AAF849_05910 [Bacteroidota bacterium]
MKSPLNDLHKRAMHLADEAFYAKKDGQNTLAQEKYLEAFEYEKAAAMLLVQNYEMEPTRSVFFRSAACLLLNLPLFETEHHREAEKMVAFGLSGNPPAEIAQELRDAWKELMNLKMDVAA